MDWQKYIISNPKILPGKALVKGTKLSVEFVLGLFASGWTEQQIFEKYPKLSIDALKALFAFTVETMRNEALCIPKKAERKKSISNKSVFQLKISLDDIRPSIYRTILVPETITLNQLHLIIQEAMGWENYHLHQFTIKGKKYTEYFEYDDYVDDSEDDIEIYLSELNLDVKDEFKYRYDFGDCWDHTIKVEKILPYDSSVKRAFCIKGAMKCPPEDVGSTDGYKNFRKIISNPNHKAYEETLEWAGGKFDPKEFNINKVNKALAKLKIK